MGDGGWGMGEVIEENRAFNPPSPIPHPPSPPQAPPIPASTGETRDALRALPWSLTMYAVRLVKPEGPPAEGAERAWVERAREGDAAAFRAIFDRYAPGV